MKDDLELKDDNQELDFFLSFSCLTILWFWICCILSMSQL